MSHGLIRQEKNRVAGALNHQLRRANARVRRLERTLDDLYQVSRRATGLFNLGFNCARTEALPTKVDETGTSALRYDKVGRKLIRRIQRVRNQARRALRNQ